MGINLPTLPRDFRHFDWTLFGCTLGLTMAGWGMVYSAALPLGIAERLVTKQVVAGLIGLAGCGLLATMHYQQFLRWAWWGYGGVIGLLGAVLVAGVRIHGTRGWFAWGPISFQPAELAKLAIIIVLAVYLDRHWDHRHQLPVLTQSALLVLGHVGLILLQPDVSGCLVYFPILLALWFCAGMKVWYLACALLCGVTTLGIPLAATWFNATGDGGLVHSGLSSSRAFWHLTVQGPGAWPAFVVGGVACGGILAGWWILRRGRVRIRGVYPLSLCGIIVVGGVSGLLIQRSLKQYQRERLTIFVNPDADPLGAGYNVLQAKVAIGNGGLFGKGYRQGTQSRLGFLPAQHTDFIFAVLAEEAGFFRALGIIGLIGGILWRIYHIAVEARDRLGALLASGVFGMFGFHFLLNLGMVLGLCPVAGLPLPFVSYGGSSLVISWWAVGLLESVHLRRFVY